MKNYLLIMLTMIVTSQMKAQTINIDEDHWTRFGPDCAWVKSIGIAPSNEEVLYLGTFSSGVYKTTNAGQNWTFCSTENLPEYEDEIYIHNDPSWYYGDYYAVDAIAVDPFDENHVWIGTMDMGLYESSDGGDSWQIAHESLPESLTINLININPEDPNDILIGTDYSPDLTGVTGLYRTFNGGESWNLIEDLPNGDSYSIADVIRDPSDNNHIIVSIVSAGEPGFNWGLVESYDNGMIWQNLCVDEVKFVNIIMDLEDSQKLWAEVYTGFQDYWLMNSVDGGFSWEICEGFDDPYVWVVGLFQDKEGNLFIKRVGDPERSTYDILRTADDGNTWTEVDQLTNKDYAGIENFKTLCASSTGGDVYTGNLYGVYHTNDGGITTTVVTDGVMNSYIDDIEINPKNQDMIYAGGSQGLWKSVDGGKNWENIIREDISTVKCDPIHPDTIYFGGWNLWRSFDGGQTIEQIEMPLDFLVHNIAIHPTETNKVFYELSFLFTTYIFRSEDCGENLEQIHSCSSDDAYQMVIDPSRPDTMYLGKHRSIDGGDNWNEAYNNFIISVHPHDSKTLFALGSEYYTLKVSYDWGETFEPLATYYNGPNNSGIHCFRLDEEHPDTMFYTTLNTPVQYSLDGGQNWNELEGDYDYRVLDVISYTEQEKFYLATHGSGVWIYDSTLITPVTDYNFVCREGEMLKIAPNPFSVSTNIQYQLEEVSTVQVSVYDMQGSLVNVLNQSKQQPGEYQLTWDATDSRGKKVDNGIYFIQLCANNKTYTEKIVLIK